MGDFDDIDDGDAPPFAPVVRMTPSEARFAKHARNFQTVLRGVDQVGSAIGQESLAADFGKWAIFGFGAFLLVQVLKE